MGATSTTASRSSQRTATAFEQYVSGRRAIVTGAVFFLETADHFERVRRVAAPGDTIIAPAAVRPDDDAIGTAGVAEIGYEGAWQVPGDEMTLDGQYAFELRDYVAIPFLSVVGPTVVRLRSADGLAAFLSDADTARHSGIFVNQLLSGAVLLDSLASFTRADPTGDSLVRVHVTADGEYRDGADGHLLGRVGDERGDIERIAASTAPRGRSLARIVDREVFEGELDVRPWFERYLAALDLLRQWDGAPGRPTVAGFGGHLVTALDEHDAVHAIVSPAAPFLVTVDGEEYVVVARESRRRFRLDVEEARAAECLIATGDESAASALLAAERGRPTVEIADAVRGLRRRFLDAGVDLTAYGRDSASQAAGGSA